MFYREGLLAPHPTPKLEDHPLSAVRESLLNLFAATHLIGGRSSIRNLRTRHAVVTATHFMGYADDANMLGGSMHNLKENAETLVSVTREIGLEVLIKLSTWLCLEIRMQDEITV